MAKKTIKLEEQEAAAKHFTISNLALIELVERFTDIDRAYDEVDGILQQETGCSANEELRDWRKAAKKAKEGDYVYEEWQKSKSRWGFK